MSNELSVTGKSGGGVELTTRKPRAGLLCFLERAREAGATPHRQGFTALATTTEKEAGQGVDGS